jgi:hypothetical protein
MDGQGIWARSPLIEPSVAPPKRLDIPAVGKKLRPLVWIFIGIIWAFNHLDLICHLDFDICHSNPGMSTFAVYVP